MTLNDFKGYAFAAIAAAAYGTNPVFAIPLYEQGIDPNSVLLFRYLLGIPVVGFIMRARHISFYLKQGEFWTVCVLGILMALSSLTLFESYRFMNAGIASTLLFIYPIMVAVIMILFFHEKFRISVVSCLLIMSLGLYMLMKPQNGESISLTGIILVMISALTYALYIVFTNVSKTLKTIPTSKLLFYVLCWGSLLFWVQGIVCGGVTIPSKKGDWLSLMALAIIPTVISLICTTRAIQIIGSTSTAILGALEPVSAVILSVTILGQEITARDIAGGLLILLSTMIIIGDRPIGKLILRVRKMFPMHYGSSKHRD